MTPDQRVSFIKNKFQRDLGRITKTLSGQAFQLIGTKAKPRGIRIETTKQTLKSISKLPFIGWSFTDRDKNKKSKLKEDSYFCFRALFQVQIEGRKTGIQTLEERHILIRADSESKAEIKVRKEFKDYEKPYLNPYGQLVRWKFESFLGSYQTFTLTEDRFDDPVEVFSTFRGRRLKKESFWDGN